MASISSDSEALENNISSSSIVTAKAASEVEPKDKIFEELAKLEYLQSDGVYMELAHLEIISNYIGRRGVFPTEDYGSNFGNGIRAEIVGSEGQNLKRITLCLRPEYKFAFLGEVIQKLHGNTLECVELDGIFKVNCGVTNRKRHDQIHHFVARMAEAAGFIKSLPNLRVLTINIPYGFWYPIPKSLGTFFLENSVDSGSQKRLTFTRAVPKIDVKLGPINERDSTSGDNS